MSNINGGNSAPFSTVSGIRPGTARNYLICGGSFSPDKSGNLSECLCVAVVHDSRTNSKPSTSRSFFHGTRRPRERATELSVRRGER